MEELTPDEVDCIVASRTMTGRFRSDVLPQQPRSAELIICDDTTQYTKADFEALEKRAASNYIDAKAFKEWRDSLFDRDLAKRLGTLVEGTHPKSSGYLSRKALSQVNETLACTLLPGTYTACYIWTLILSGEMSSYHSGDKPLRRYSVSTQFAGELAHWILRAIRAERNETILGSVDCLQHILSPTCLSWF